VRKFTTAESLFVKRAPHRFYGQVVDWLSGNEQALSELCGKLKSFENDPRATLQFKLTAEREAQRSYSWLLFKLQQDKTWQISVEPEVASIVIWLNHELLRELCETIGHAIADDDYCHDYCITAEGRGFAPTRSNDVLDITCSK
jgi:hypothetical protein